MKWFWIILIVLAVVVLLWWWWRSRSIAVGSTSELGADSPVAPQQSAATNAPYIDPSSSSAAADEATAADEVGLDADATVDDPGESSGRGDAGPGDEPRP